MRAIMTCRTLAKLFALTALAAVITSPHHPDKSTSSGALSRALRQVKNNLGGAP
jgi:hypothetical protein